MLAVPCGLPSYTGTWPPVVAGGPIIEPLADLALCSPHASTSGAWRKLTRADEDELADRPGTPNIRDADRR